MSRFVAQPCVSCGTACFSRTQTCRTCWRASVREASVSSLAERLWSGLDQSGGPEACWPWVGHRRFGYGRISAGSRQRAAHRLALELTLGRPIADGMSVLHRCDNPPCCNPSHLYEGTQTDNVRDMYERGRWDRGPVCPKGHDRSWMRGKPSRRGRWCLICSREWQRAKRARRKAALQVVAL